MRTQREHYYVFGSFRLEPQECRLQRDGLLVPLTPKAFEMLLLLVRHSGSLVEKEFLMQELWPDAFVEEANLTFTISVIRKALGENARSAGYIETVPKRGYRFTAPVREVRSEHDVKSLAVLPFVNLTPGEGGQYIADGMQDALIAELAQIRSLRVISRASSMQHNRTARPLPAFARALELDFVVEGSVSLEPERVRINVRLIDALHDRHVWAQSYEPRLGDLLSWQSEVARSIAQQIEVTLTPHEDARLRQVHSVNPEAHAAYLRGLFYWHQSFTETAFRTAITHFRHATNLEPGYARAWSGVANCFSAMAVQAMVPPREGATEARHAAGRALALDPLLPEAHASMAGVHLFFEWDWASAERALRKATELSPSYSLAHNLFTHYAVARGWREHAIAAARRSLDLDPMSLVASVDLAWAYLLTRDYPKALEHCVSVLDMTADFPLARIYLSQVHQCMGNHEAAIQEITKALPSNGDAPAPILAMLGCAYGLAGRSEAAREILRRIDTLAGHTYVSPYDRAVVHAGLRDKKEALRCLREALTERSPRMIWLNVEPAFDSLRGDRQFQNIARRLGLE